MDGFSRQHLPDQHSVNPALLRQQFQQRPPSQQDHRSFPVDGMNMGGLAGLGGLGGPGPINMNTMNLGGLSASTTNGLNMGMGGLNMGGLGGMGGLNMGLGMNNAMGGLSNNMSMSMNMPGTALGFSQSQIAQLQAQGANTQQIQAMQAKLISQAMARQSANQSRNQFSPDMGTPNLGHSSHSASPHGPQPPQPNFLAHQAASQHHSPQLLHQPSFPTNSNPGQGLATMMAHQQSAQGAGAFFDRDRPSSATSTHSNHHAGMGMGGMMMPPPAPRPPSVRPGTGHSHRATSVSAQSPGATAAAAGAPPLIQRPPSRPRTASGSGFPAPGTPQMRRTPTPVQQPMGSPAPRKRKASEAPPPSPTPTLGASFLGGAGGGLMGPPHVVPARTSAGADGTPVKQQSVGPDAVESDTTPAATAALPTLAGAELEAIQGWVRKDKAYQEVFRAMKERMADEVRETRARMGGAWWEVPSGKRPAKFSVTYPGQRLKEMGRKRGRREGFKLPSKVKPEDAARAEQLVPIRLEFDVEHQKMRDTFVWNLNDPIITPEVFAQSVVDDYGLAPSYHSVIVKAIQDQLSDYRMHTASDGTDADNEDEGVIRGRLEEDSEDAKWWEGWRRQVGEGRKRVGRKRRRVQEEVKKDVFGPVVPAEGSKDKEALDATDVDMDDLKEDMRIVIKLDIIVGSMKLDDQFEWDIDNQDASPEQFAEVYAKELGLAGEFKTAIAHSIREQVQTYQKSLFLVGHPSDGTAVQDDDLRMSFLSPVQSVARAMDQVQAFTPLLNYLSDSEIERNEKEREKELNRRRKRNTRGRRGVPLPDREPPKTFRTPAIGFPDVDPAVLALQQAAAAPTSRRAAAAAASLTIANMVASENGTALVAPSLPMATPTPAPAQKDKKPRGLFKSPDYPRQRVLRPRAYVAAPTPSTAADAASLPPPLENDPPAPVPSAPPDTRATRVITAKRAKELEREAKEKGFADGQHANMIDGVWHCSNCGCPEDIAIGRRKGPLGDKSQCGTCGKFWHRHRRPRPVVYNADHAFHLNQRNEAERSKTVSKKKGAAAAMRAAADQGADQDARTGADPDAKTGADQDARTGADQDFPTPADQDAPTPKRRGNAKGEGWGDAGARRAASPASDGGSSSASESPLAQKMKQNGGGAHAKADSAPPLQDAPEPRREDGTLPPQPPAAHAASASAPPNMDGAGAPNASTLPTVLPEWLVAAKAGCLAQYPNDRFDFLPRHATPGSPMQWRIKCLDCPGKLYMPGPGETLNNFDVHLRNRQHRSKVNERMGREGGGP